MQIAKFENLFAFVRELINCIMSGATVEFEMSNTPKAIGVIFEENNL